MSHRLKYSIISILYREKKNLMTTKRYLFISTIITAVAWILWGMVVRFIDPNTGSKLALFLFYISLLIALSSSFTIIGYLIRKLTTSDEITRERLNIAWRQGILFSILIVISLMLKAANQLNWLTVIVTILILSLVEFFFLSLASSKK